MGCDIHCFIEHQHPRDTYWTVFSGEIRGSRDYNLFAALAGVRGAGPTPKGLPENLSWGAQDAWDEGKSDWHSPTWLTLRDLSDTLSRLPLPRDPEYHAMLAAMQCFENMGYRTRLICWFDN